MPFLFSACKGDMNGVNQGRKYHSPAHADPRRMLVAQARVGAQLPLLRHAQGRLARRDPQRPRARVRAPRHGLLGDKSGSDSDAQRPC